MFAIAPIDRAAQAGRPCMRSVRGSMPWCMLAVGLVLFGTQADAVAQCQFNVVWTQRDESSGFSKSIAIGDDFIAIGAPEDSSSDPLNVAGAVYVYSGEPGQPWTYSFSQLLAPAGVRNDEEFGFSADAHGDLLVVGARKGDGFPSFQSDTGLVYVFRRSEGSGLSSLGTCETIPQLQEKLGFSVAVSGNTIAAGATEYDRDYPNDDLSGRVVVFEPSDEDPDHWDQAQSILPPPTTTNGAQFGFSVALSEDTLVVGAPFSQEFGFSNSGAAFVYQRNATNPRQWDFLTRLNPDPAANARFGWAVETDGQVIIITAPRRGGSGLPAQAGRAYAYSRDPVNGLWNFTTPTFLDPPVGITNQAWFGTSASYHNGVLAIGAPATATATDPIGTVFLATRTGLSTWSPFTSLRQDLPGADSDFGETLAVQNGALIVGDPNWNVDAGDYGVGRSYWFYFQPGAPDCDGDGEPNACEIAVNGAPDCDLDGKPDNCPNLPPIAVWTAQYKGIFSDPDSWCADLPSPLHNVIFRNESPDGFMNEIVAIHPATVLGMEVRRGWPSFVGDLGAITIRAQGSLFDGYPLRVGVLPEHARLDVIGSTLNVGDAVLPGSAVLASVSGSSVEMLVSGATAHLNVSQDLDVAKSGPASLSIADGALVRSSELSVGSRLEPEAVGTVTLLNPGNVNTPAPSLQVDVQARIERGVMRAESRAQLNFGGGGIIVERDGALLTDAPIQGNVVNVGTLAALHSPATININGSYQQVGGDVSNPRIGRLHLDLTDGVETDELHATGLLGLNGGLIVSADPDFDPANGERFQIISAESGFSGQFSVASFPGLPGYRFLRLEYNAVTGGITLVVDSLNSSEDRGLGGSHDYTVSQQVRDAALGLFTSGDVGGDFPDLAAIAVGATPGEPGGLYILRNTGVRGPSGEIFTGDVAYIPVPPQPLALAVGNFDHDSSARDDIAIVHENGTVTLIYDIDLSTTPAGRRESFFPATAVTQPLDIIAADFDGGAGVTRNADIAIIGADASGIGTVAVRLNSGGSGSGWLGLGSPRTFQTGAGTLLFADAGGVDNDKDLDLVCFRDNSSNGALLLNRRGGVGSNWNGFAAALDFDVGVIPVSADAGDLDNDEDLDLFVAGRSGDEGSFAVLLNDGTGVFGAPAILPLGGEPGTVVLARLDSDLDPDAAVIVVDPIDGPVIRVFRNDSDDSQLAFSNIGDQGDQTNPILLLAGDLDLSDTDDLVIINDTSSRAGFPFRDGPADVRSLLSLCHADLNQDSAVDFFDLQVFLNAYSAHNPLADWNSDGLWDFFDVQGFLNAYSAGCS